MESYSGGEASPSLYHPQGENRIPLQWLTPELGLPAAHRDVSHPAAGWDGANRPRACVLMGKSSPWLWSEAAGELLAAATAERCVISEQDVALPQVPILGDLVVLGPSPRGGGDTLWRGDAAGMSQSIPASCQLGHQAGQPCPPTSLARLFLLPREFPGGCRDTTEHLGLLMEPWQRGPHVSAAGTRVLWGDVGGEQSLCSGSSWSPFLLLTQCLLRSPLEVESSRAVPGSGRASPRCQGPAGVAQGRRDAAEI